MTAPGFRFKALDHLVATAPRLKGRAPYWRPPTAGIDVTMLVEPAWAWARRRVPGEKVEPVVQLDAVAAYLSAASSVEVSHGALTRTGTVEPARNLVGYVLVDLPPWHGHALPAPWGNRTLPAGPVWIAGPTMRLLYDLACDGLCDMPTVHDSWLGEHPVRLRPWADRIASARAEAIHQHDGPMYEAIKLGYSQAVTIMQTGEKSVVHRPDWAHTIRAQHAANTWLKAWRASRAGLVPLGMMEVDELAFSRTDANRILLWNTDRQGVRPLIIDRKGLRLGAFKPKEIMTGTQWDILAGKYLGRLGLPQQLGGQA